MEKLTFISKCRDITIDGLVIKSNEVINLKWNLIIKASSYGVTGFEIEIPEQEIELSGMIGDQYEDKTLVINNDNCLKNIDIINISNGIKLSQIDLVNNIATIYFN